VAEPERVEVDAEDRGDSDCEVLDEMAVCDDTAPEEDE
jgi:hypothetical protein